ncbi:6349_t:CDS:1, partial [Cetraspora pellucida]
GQGEIYDLANLPLRSHNKYRSQIQEIQNVPTILEQNHAIRRYEISSKTSILFNLRSTSFPETFPVDIMHLFYENIAGYMLAYWMRSFFTNNDQNNGEYILSKETWNKIRSKIES